MPWNSPARRRISGNVRTHIQSRKSARTAFQFTMLVLTAAASASAQTFSVGVKGGVPLTNGFSDFTAHGVDTIVRTFSTSKQYIIGPSVEVHFPVGFSVEADALYRPLDLAVNTTVISSQTVTANSAGKASWEFPILAKYRFAFPVVKPYLEAGPSFRAKSSDISWLSDRGLTLGGGVELKLGRVRLGPELRYTHWGSDAGPNSTVLFNPPSRTNQAEFLLGISF
jgi:outer membrane protein with beta-barrel domain